MTERTYPLVRGTGNTSHSSTSILAAVLLVALVFSLLPSHAKAQSSSFQTALATNKSSYYLGETVYAKLILYNPTSQKVVVHFTQGCWFNFFVQDAMGVVVHNETWPMCDPDFRTGFENSTNVMTVDPGGGRWFSMSWSPTDNLGHSLPVPADYTLSWKVVNPDQPIDVASAVVNMTDQAKSSTESFIESTSLALMEFGPFLWLLMLPAWYPTSRLLKGMKLSRRIMLLLPSVGTVIATSAILLGLYSNRLLCMAPDCSGTLAFLGGLNLYIAVSPFVWASAFLMARMFHERVWVALTILESWTFSALVVAFSILNSLRNIWQDTFYYNWAIVLPSYALFICIVPLGVIFYRTFRGDLVATSNSWMKAAPLVPQR